MLHSEHVSLDKTSYVAWLSIVQIHIVYTSTLFSCSMNGLNCVLLICMGLSLDVDTICLGWNMGGMNGFNVGDGSQCFFC